MPEDFLSNAPLSLDEIIAAVRLQSHDQSTSQPVFSEAQIKLAIRQAIVNSSGKFFTSDMTTVSYTAGTQGPYTLSADVQRIVMITRSRTGTESNAYTLSSTSFDSVVTDWRHFRKQGTNYLYLTRDYPDCTLTIWYERDIQVPVDSRTVSGSHTNAITTLTLVDADPQLFQISLPAYFRWDNEFIKVTAVSSTVNTSATIARGQLGSIAAAHADGSTISQLVMCDLPNFYNFLFQEAGRLLNTWRVQTGNQNVNVSANVTAARFFDSDRERSLRQVAQPHKQRRIKFSRTRRPRLEI